MEDLASEEEGAAIDRPCKSALVGVQLVEKGCRRGGGGSIIISCHHVLGKTKPQSSNKEFSSHSILPAPSKNHPYKRLRRLALRYFAKQARLFFLTLHNHRPWHTPWLPPARTSTNGSATSRPRPPTWSRRGGRRSFVETTRTKHLLLLLLLAVPPPPPRHDMGGAGRFLDSSRFLSATCSCLVSLRPSRCGIMAKAT